MIEPNSINQTVVTHLLMKPAHRHYERQSLRHTAFLSETNAGGAVDGEPETELTDAVYPSSRNTLRHTCNRFWDGCIGNDNAI